MKSDQRTKGWKEPVRGLRLGVEILAWFYLALMAAESAGRAAVSVFVILMAAGISIAVRGFKLSAPPEDGK